MQSFYKDKEIQMKFKYDIYMDCFSYKIFKFKYNLNVEEFIIISYNKIINDFFFF